MKSFSVLIKPASSACNLQCRYCFYTDVAEHRAVKSYGIMTRETVCRLIDGVFALMTPPAVVQFGFQGGEPTLAGLNFFEYFVGYAARKNPGVSIQYALQTNGVLVDEEWATFFKKHDFLIGLSLDGERGLHDYARLDSNRQGTYDRVMKTAKLLKKAGVDYNILSVVTKQMAKRPVHAFQFYQKHGFSFIQLIPCLKPLDGTVGPQNLGAREYAAFLKAFYREWYRELTNGKYMSVRLFDNLVRLASGQPPEQCGMLGRCSAQFVIEGDGGVYPCDFYVLDEYRCGDVQHNSLKEMMDTPAMTNFLRPAANLRPLCTGCDFLLVCGGGCRRYRSLFEEEKDYCPYQDFLSETWSGFVRVAETLAIPYS